ncbi:HNH endonuclease family protein [Priestia aryabhattai]|uniref:HNH endonuclease family protein n=1 Tax=Priestia aryabhattai TaxID=412384 RepID=UPI0027E55615|nr:DUF262 domain-containing protein [Priestia aryabhattai]WJW97227.1 DUF262 domain-containing protein [Priestia aryabhattai]
MAKKVNLDALIPREDFEVEDNHKNIGKNTSTLSITDLKEDAFFFSAIRKPDFQRETNEWDPDTICNLIESFLDGELIPALILWRSASSFTFVIDGSHRISALAAWINDDYGDGLISKQFYDGKVPDEQIEIAEKTRAIVKKKIGSFLDYQLAIKSPEKVDAKIAQRAKSLGALAIQLQWVEGDSSTAETSFFKINQHAAPIDPTEMRLLKSRKKPNGLAARAIIRSGKGHKYWSRFTEIKQLEIQELAKEVHDILFTPHLKNPIKTLDLPIGGSIYASQTLPLVLDFVNIVNGVKPKVDEVTHDELQDDIDGNLTIKFLNNCRKVARRINSKHPGSLGLHPAVYLYSQTGRHKIASFYAITALILEFENSKNTKVSYTEFTKVRETFEEIILENDYLIQQVVRRHRSALKAYPYIKDFYLNIILKLSGGKHKEKVIDEILQSKEFNYLTSISSSDPVVQGGKFSAKTKSAVFMKEALEKALKCKLCNGYIHANAITIDHIVRKQDGGQGTLENGQLSHPFCNTTMKN